jgi:mannose-1-phosphate guanylyltransferase
MILAAGLGTRLRPLTDELPKPLVPIGDRPMLAHVVAELARGGIRRAALNVFHHAPAFTRSVLEDLPIELTVLREAELLGTAGGLANAGAALGRGDVVTWNGDILAEVDVRALLSAHASFGALATLAVWPRPRGQGTIGRARDGSVVRLRGEQFGEEALGGDFLGIQVIGDVLRALVPPRGCLVGDAYLPALRRGAKLASFDVRTAWADVGTLRAYLQANLDWLAAAGHESWLGAGAHLGSKVEPRTSVIGAGAVVEGEGLLHECVIWPGARARAPLHRVIVTGSGRVVPVD